MFWCPYFGRHIFEELSHPNDNRRWFLVSLAFLHLHHILLVIIIIIIDIVIGKMLHFYDFKITFYRQFSFFYEITAVKQNSNIHTQSHSYSHTNTHELTHTHKNANCKLQICNKNVNGMLLRVWPNGSESSGQKHITISSAIDPVGYALPHLPPRHANPWLLTFSAWWMFEWQKMLPSSFLLVFMTQTTSSKIYHNILQFFIALSQIHLLTLT